MQRTFRNNSRGVHPPTKPSLLDKPFRKPQLFAIRHQHPLKEGALGPAAHFHRCSAHNLDLDCGGHSQRNRRMSYQALLSPFSKTLIEHYVRHPHPLSQMTTKRDNDSLREDGLRLHHSLEKFKRKLWMILITACGLRGAKSGRSEKK